MFRHACLPCLLAALLAMPSAYADEASSLGLPVGETAPPVELLDQDRQLRKLSELLKEGPVALVFHRSADW